MKSSSLLTVFRVHPHFTKPPDRGAARAPHGFAPRLVRRMEVQDLRAVAVDGKDLSSRELGLGVTRIQWSYGDCTISLAIFSRDIMGDP